MISHCGFALHFSDGYRYWAFFHVLVGHLYAFSGKMSIQVSAHFLIGLFVFCCWVVWTVLDINCLDINPLSVIAFANIFSHSVGCLFIWLMVFFAVQKPLSLLRSHLFIFGFISFALGDRSKKILLWLMWVFCLCWVF